MEQLLQYFFMIVYQLSTGAINLFLMVSPIIAMYSVVAWWIKRKRNNKRF